VVTLGLSVHVDRHLRAVYAAMPQLIPHQRLITPRSDASLQDSVTRPHPAVGGEASMVRDIIDPDWANLVIDIRSGDLTLIDINRLISARKLAQLHVAGQPLNVKHRRIHGLSLRRLMYLESHYLGTPATLLMRDPLYTRYLHSAGFEELFTASAAAGEPIH
jgi:hypothetical protein